MSLFPPPDDHDSTPRKPSNSRPAPQEPGYGKVNFIASGSTTLEAPDIVRAAFLTEIGLPIYLLTPTPARMTMKIGKTIWARLLLPGTTAGPSNPHWVKMVQDHDRETRARFDRAMKSWAFSSNASSSYSPTNDYGDNLFRTKHVQILPLTHLLTRAIGKTVCLQNGNLEIATNDLWVFKSLGMESRVAIRMFAQRGKNKAVPI